MAMRARFIVALQSTREHRGLSNLYANDIFVDAAHGRPLTKDDTNIRADELDVVTSRSYTCLVGIRYIRLGY